MSVDRDQLIVLVLDNQLDRQNTIIAALATYSCSGLSCASFADLVAALDTTSVAAALICWPQKGIEPTALTPLLTTRPDLPILLIEDQSTTSTSDNLPQVPRISLHSLAAWIILLRQLHTTTQELAWLRNQLFANARNIVLGEIIGGVAHDLNNPLTAILGNTELLPEQPTEEDQQGVAQILESAHKAQRLINSLLILTRTKLGQEQWFDPTNLVYRTSDLVLAMLRSRNIRLHIEIQPGMPQFWGEFSQLQQALLHLLHNAIQAVSSQDTREIVIRASYTTGAQQSLTFEIYDNGSGIPVELRELVFTRFFTTRPGGQGAGLGLAVARDIAERAGGSLHYFIPETGGAGFRIWLPLRMPELVLHDH